MNFLISTTEKIDLNNGDSVRQARLVRWVGFVLDMKLHSVGTVTERTTENLLPIPDNTQNPLHIVIIIIRQECVFCDILLSLPCTTERLKNSFEPRFISSTTPPGSEKSGTLLGLIDRIQKKG